MTAPHDSLRALAERAVSDASHWPVDWSAEMDVDGLDDDGGGLAYFRCWAATSRDDGSTIEMTLGSEDYDDTLASYIATMNKRESQLAVGVLALLDERKDLLHPDDFPGCSVFADDFVKGLTAERDEARAEVERMRSVVEAAEQLDKALHIADRDSREGLYWGAWFRGGGDHASLVRAVRDALDVYRAAKGGRDE